MWAAMRALSRGHGEGQLFTPADVMALTRLHVDTVCTYFRGLALARPPYLELVDRNRPVGRAHRECFRYRLARDTGVDTPNVTAHGKPTQAGLGAERMWLAMKALREFDCRELAAIASDDGHAVRVATVKTYVKFLARAGYLTLAVASMRLRGGQGGAAAARYRFTRSMNTGPRAPLVCRDKSVVDANTGAVVWSPRGSLGSSKFADAAASLANTPLPQ